MKTTTCFTMIETSWSLIKWGPGKELKNHFQVILIFYLRWFICLRIKHSFNNSLTKFLSQLS